MGTQASGILVNAYVRDPGVTQWRKIVCTTDSTFTISANVTKRETNCGIKAGVGRPQFSASGTAVQNPEPTSSEASYDYLKTRMKNRQYQEFKYQSDADSASGLTEGEAVYNYCDVFISNLEITANSEDGSVVEYSWEVEGYGTLDDFESEVVN